MKITITIDPPLLRKIKEICLREHKTLTAVVREVLLSGLKNREKRSSAPSPFRNWKAIHMMGAQVDYTDNEALSKIFGNTRERGG